MKFTSWDQDNDFDDSMNCAITSTSAWWYNRCHRSDLNGLYLAGAHEEPVRGVTWSDWTGIQYLLGLQK